MLKNVLLIYLLFCEGLMLFHSLLLLILQHLLSVLIMMVVLPLPQSKHMGQENYLITHGSSNNVKLAS